MQSPFESGTAAGQLVEATLPRINESGANTVMYVCNKLSLLYSNSKTYIVYTKLSVTLSNTISIDSI